MQSQLFFSACGPEHSDKDLVGYRSPPLLGKFFLASFLFLKQLSFPGDIPAVEIPRNVLAERRQRFASNNAPLNKRLNGNDKQLARQILSQPPNDLFAFGKRT